MTDTDLTTEPTTDLTTEQADAATLAAMERAEALVGRLLASYTAGAELLTVEVGRRLGLYAHLDVAGPSTVAELARSAQVPERYAREWLEQQGAAGLLDVVEPAAGIDPAERRFLLPAGHAPVLLDAESPAHVVGLAPLLLAVARTVPALTDAIRAGRGVPYAEYGPELRDAIASLNRPGFIHGMRAWVHAMPDVAERLAHGGTVLDAGAGEGWSAIGIATAFPAARVVAVDLDEASVERARQNVAVAGLAGRVSVVVANAADARALGAAVGGAVDLVTVFQALHDMGRPAEALRAFRSLLAPGGAVLVGDEAGPEEYAAPADDRTRLQYAVSVLHCLPATWAEDAASPNGTVLRPSTVQRWAREAGFEGAEQLPVEHPFWRFFRL